MADAGSVDVEVMIASSSFTLLLPVLLLSAKGMSASTVTCEALLEALRLELWLTVSLCSAPAKSDRSEAFNPFSGSDWGECGDKGDAGQLSVEVLE